MKVTGIILAGGKSTRLGRNKSFETVIGKTLVRHVFDCLSAITPDIVIVTASEMAGLPYPEGSRVLVDVYPDKGPLSGIFTGLSRSQNEYAAVVGCDMPLVNRSLVQHMISLCPGFDAVVPMLDASRVEPLHAVYSRNCLAAMKTMLEGGHLQIRLLFDRINVKYIDMKECRDYDPNLESFININDENDLTRAVEIMRRRAGNDSCE